MNTHTLTIPLVCYLCYGIELRKYQGIVNIPPLTDSIDRTVSITLYNNRYLQGSNSVEAPPFKAAAFARELIEMKLAPAYPRGKARQFYSVTTKYSRNDPRIEVVFNDREKKPKVFAKDGSS